jgi:histidine ammonia-lyase
LPASQEQVMLALKRVPAARLQEQVVERIVAENRVVYGVNTGFGKLSDVRIDPTNSVSCS